jgi:hypothetical protein
MRRVFTIAGLAILIAAGSLVCLAADTPPTPFLFTSFRGNGEDGLHLAWSKDGYFDRYTEHRYGLVTSKDLVHWDDESDKVRFPADHRHGSVVRVSQQILEGLMRP